MERVKGIEPSRSAWKAEVLPLNYTRKWWREKDLNLRSLWQQIYSLPPLATREPLRVRIPDISEPVSQTHLSKRYAPSGKSPAPQIPAFWFPVWSWWWDSNPQPADYEPAALPIELHQRTRLDARYRWAGRPEYLKSPWMSNKSLAPLALAYVSYIDVGNRPACGPDH